MKSMNDDLYLTALSNRSITLLSSMAFTITSSHNYSFVSKDEGRWRKMKEEEEEEEEENECNNKMKKGFDVTPFSSGPACTLH